MVGSERQKPIFDIPEKGVMLQLRERIDENVAAFELQFCHFCHFVKQILVFENVILPRGIFVVEDFADCGVSLHTILDSGGDFGNLRDDFVIEFLGDFVSANCPNHLYDSGFVSRLEFI